MYVGDDEFEHMHDRAEIRVFIKITTQSGLIQRLKIPILMTGATKFTYRRGNKLLYSIIERIRRNHRIERISRETVSKISGNVERKGHSFGALYRSVNIAENVIPKVFRLKNSSNERKSEIWRDYLEALDDACVMGYCWARAEAELNMKPLALSALKSRIGARTAGQASGKARRAKAEQTWMAHAQVLARQIEGGSGRLSQEKLASEIEARWKLSGTIPSHKSLVALISQARKRER